MTGILSGLLTGIPLALRSFYINKVKHRILFERNLAVLLRDFSPVVLMFGFIVICVGISIIGENKSEDMKLAGTAVMMVGGIISLYSGKRYAPLEHHPKYQAEKKS